MGWTNLFPTDTARTLYDLDFQALYDAGFRGIIYDIDNTLVGHGAPMDTRAYTYLKAMQEMGFALCFVSNNGEARVASFNEHIGAHYVYKAGKPKRYGYERAMELMGTTTDDTLFFGDQIFTDIWGAKRLGIPCILTKRLYPQEEIQIHFKRILEWGVLLTYCLYRKVHPADFLEKTGSVKKE